MPFEDQATSTSSGLYVCPRKPHQYSVGFRDVIVSGKVALRNDARPASGRGACSTALLFGVAEKYRPSAASSALPLRGVLAPTFAITSNNQG